MTDAAADTDVLVVGAGPTGLMLANWLARAGIRVVVIDGKDGPTRESRAVVTQARTLEIYDQLGIVDAFLAHAEAVRTLAPGFERRAFGRLAIGDLGARVTAFPRLYMLEQSVTETLLYDNLRALGGDVLWSTRLQSLTNLADGVHARLSTESAQPDTQGARSGSENARSDTGPATSAHEVNARFAVGADGSNSAVRRALGIRFQGITNEQAFFVIDADDARGLAHDAVNVRLGSRDFLLTFPLRAEHRLRLIGTVPSAEGGDDVDEVRVRARLEQTYGVTWGESRWSSTYRVHHRVAEVFRSGNVFLAGDAAHVHSPVGAQGMNTGLQDAHGLALKLIDVCRGVASAASLDRYEAERRPVALRLIRTTDRMFRIATSTRFAERMVRRTGITIGAPILLKVLPRLGIAPRMFGYVSQTRIHYWMSERERSAARGRRDAVVGRRLPWAGGNHDFLRSAEWQVHSYGGVTPDQVERVRAALGVAVESFPSAPSTPLRPGTFYLVRPDGFVAASAAPATAVRAFVEALPDRWPATSGGLGLA